jgi:Tfp pilus assembly protein FimT
MEALGIMLLIGFAAWFSICWREDQEKKHQLELSRARTQARVEAIREMKGESK